MSNLPNQFAEKAAAVTAPSPKTREHAVGVSLSEQNAGCRVHSSHVLNSVVATVASLAGDKISGHSEGDEIFDHTLLQPQIMMGIVSGNDLVNGRPQCVEVA